MRRKVCFHFVTVDLVPAPLAFVQHQERIAVKVGFVIVVDEIDKDMTYPLAEHEQAVDFPPLGQ